MPTFRQTILLFSVIPLSALAACDGYEIQAYHGTPYNGRTAGSGVEYVLAKMAPAKGPVLEEETKKAEPAPEAVEDTPPPPPPAAAAEPAPVPHQAEEIFNKQQKK